MRKGYVFAAMFAAAISIVFYGAGCNPFSSFQEKAEEKAAEKLTEKMLESMGGDNIDVDLTKDGGTVKIKDEEGGGELLFGDKVELPSDLQKDILIYPDSILKGVVRGMGGERSVMVTLLSDDSVSGIIKWYEGRYTGDGWKKSQTVSVNGNEMRGFEKGNERVFVTAGTTQEDEQVMITVNWLVEEEE